MAKIWNYKEEEVKAAAEMAEQPVEFVNVWHVIYARFPKVETWGEYTDLRHALTSKLGVDPRENLKWEDPKLPGVILEIGRTTRGHSPIDPIQLYVGIPCPNSLIKDALEELNLRAKGPEDIEDFSETILCNRISFCYEEYTWFVLLPNDPEKIFLTTADEYSIYRLLKGAGCSDIKFEIED